MKLRIGDFKRIGEPGSFQHYFSHKLPDGREMCLEACVAGYCVGLYNKRGDLLGKKICTNFPDMLEMQIVPGHSLLSGDALTKAVDIANTII